MHTKYSSMISSSFVNNLLSSLCFCRGHSESTPYNTSSSLSELFLIECRRSGGDCFVGHEVSWLVCGYRLGRSLASDPVRTCDKLNIVYPQKFPVYGIQPYLFGLFVLRLDRRVLFSMFSPCGISPSVWI